MRFQPICSAALLGLAAAAAAAPTNNHYENFDGLVSGGPAATAFGTAVDGDAFGTVFGGGATVGFSNVAGYPDDATSALSFTSFESNALQNADVTNILGDATRPYGLSFALKVVDSNSTGSFAQIIAPGNFFSGPGFRTIFQVQLWDADFLTAGDPSYFVITPINPANNNANFRQACVPGILEGANGFVDDGSAWNVVLMIADPDATTLKVWVNPASSAAAPDLNDTAFSFGSIAPPMFLSYGAYTFAADTTPGSSKAITVDSVKIWHDEADLDALFAAMYASYSTLPASDVADWALY